MGVERHCKRCQVSTRLMSKILGCDHSEKKSLIHVLRHIFIPDLKCEAFSPEKGHLTIVF